MSVCIRAGAPRTGAAGRRTPAAPAPVGVRLDGEGTDVPAAAAKNFFRDCQSHCDFYGVGEGYGVTSDRAIFFRYCEKDKTVPVYFFINFGAGTRGQKENCVLYYIEPDSEGALVSRKGQNGNVAFYKAVESGQHVNEDCVQLLQSVPARSEFREHWKFASESEAASKAVPHVALKSFLGNAERVGAVISPAAEAEEHYKKERELVKYMGAETSKAHARAAEADALENDLRNGLFFIPAFAVKTWAKRKLMHFIIMQRTNTLGDSPYYTGSRRGLLRLALGVAHAARALAELSQGKYHFTDLKMDNIGVSYDPPGKAETFDDKGFEKEAHFMRLLDYGSVFSRDTPDDVPHSYLLFDQSFVGDELYTDEDGELLYRMSRDSKLPETIACWGILATYINLIVPMTGVSRYLKTMEEKGLLTGSEAFPHIDEISYKEQDGTRSYVRPGMLLVMNRPEPDSSQWSDFEKQFLDKVGTLMADSKQEEQKAIDAEVHCRTARDKAKANLDNLKEAVQKKGTRGQAGQRAVAMQEAETKLFMADRALEAAVGAVAAANRNTLNLVRTYESNFKNGRTCALRGYPELWSSVLNGIRDDPFLAPALVQPLYELGAFDISKEGRTVRDFQDALTYERLVRAFKVGLDTLKEGKVSIMEGYKLAMKEHPSKLPMMESIIEAEIKALRSLTTTPGAMLTKFQHSLMRIMQPSRARSQFDRTVAGGPIQAVWDGIKESDPAQMFAIAKLLDFDGECSRRDQNGAKLGYLCASWYARALLNASDCHFAKNTKSGPILGTLTDLVNAVYDDADIPGGLAAPPAGSGAENQTYVRAIRTILMGLPVMCDMRKGESKADGANLGFIVDVQYKAGRSPDEAPEKLNSQTKSAANFPSEGDWENKKASEIVEKDGTLWKMDTPPKDENGGGQEVVVGYKWRTRLVPPQDDATYDEMSKRSSSLECVIAWTNGDASVGVDARDALLLARNAGDVLGSYKTASPTCILMKYPERPTVVNKLSPRRDFTEFRLDLIKGPRSKIPWEEKERPLHQYMSDRPLETTELKELPEEDKEYDFEPSEPKGSERYDQFGHFVGFGSFTPGRLVEKWTQLASYFGKKYYGEWSGAAINVQTYANIVATGKWLNNTDIETMALMEKPLVELPSVLPRETCSAMADSVKDNGAAGADQARKAWFDHALVVFPKTSSLTPTLAPSLMVMNIKRALGRRTDGAATWGGASAAARRAMPARRASRMMRHPAEAPQRRTRSAAAAENASTPAVQAGLAATEPPATPSWDLSEIVPLPPGGENEPLTRKDADFLEEILNPEQPAGPLGLDDDGL